MTLFPLIVGAAAMARQPAAMTVTMAGWPGLGHLTVEADGGAVRARDGRFEVGRGSTVTFYAAGIELGSMPAKNTVTIFDLAPAPDCGSTPELGKLLSLLLARGENTRRSIEAPKRRLADMTEEELLAVEKRRFGRGVPVRDALERANAAIDGEKWAEQGGEKTVFTDDMEVLKTYLKRAIASLSLSTPSVSGFGAISGEEIARIPATLKNQGLAFDGRTPVFSWRYGLERTDADYKPILTRPLAIPPDIQAEHYDPASRKGFSHIGDIDIAGGRLYAPIENEDFFTKSFVAVFDPKTLQYTGEKHLVPTSRGIPWIAVDAGRGVFYTMVWDSQDLLVFDLGAFKPLRTVPLKILNPGFPGQLLEHIQGAKLRGGMLYASSDSTDKVPGPSGSILRRKRVYKIDPESGGALELFHYDEPDLSETEGLAFGPDGRLHVIVMAPYYYNASFPPEFEIDNDDWNPTSRLAHYVLKEESERERLCRLSR